MKGQKVCAICIVFVSVLLSFNLVTPVVAIVPQVTNVVVWSSGGDTILNVTVFHTPRASLHHVDRIEVNISGDIQIFPVAPQPTTTFTTPCNLGPVEGAPLATVRAHCILDGYSSWSEPIAVPEFSLSALMLILAFTTSMVVFVLRRIRLLSHR